VRYGGCHLVLVKTDEVARPDNSARGLPHNEFIAQMRGVAVLVVVLMHYVGCFPMNFVPPPLRNNGYYGVALFFAISGFLITSNLLVRYGDLASISLRDFYVTRAARILPCLTLAVVPLSAITLATSLRGFVFPSGLSVSGAIGHILTLRFNRYYIEGAMAASAWAVLWSISIEELFYLVYPLVAVAVRRENLLIAVLMIVIVHGPISRLKSDGLLTYFGSFDLMDMGALAAIAAHRIRSLPERVAFGLKWSGASIALGTYLFLGPQPYMAIGPSLLAFGASLMLFANQTRQSAPSQRRTLLGSIGSTSYEIYLFHVMFFLLLPQVFPKASGASAYVLLAVSLALLYAICISIARWFSKPLNRTIRSRWLRSATV
jgi:peptidoglycan/LPS O-acetylase OafA/YrhL